MVVNCTEGYHCEVMTLLKQPPAEMYMIAKFTRHKPKYCPKNTLGQSLNHSKTQEFLSPHRKNFVGSI